MISLLEVAERTQTGDKVEEKKWDMELFHTISQLVKKYGIEFPGEHCFMNTDDDLVERAFEAGIECLERMGVYCITTRRRVRFSREEIKKVTTLISLHMIDYNEAWTDAAVRRLIRRAGWDNIHELLILRKADIIAHGTDDNKMDLMVHLEERIEKMKIAKASIDINDLALDGKKVMDIMGLDPGPEVGNILSKLLELIIDDPELNSEDKLTDILNKFRQN